MRRPFWLASAIFLVAAVVCGLVWVRFHLAAARRLASWEERQKVAATRDVLERLVTLEGGPMPLSDFAALIEKESGLAVEFDEPSLAITRYPVQPAATIPVLVPRATLTLHSAIRLTLQPKRLWADLRGKSLVITRWDNSLDRIRLETVVYPLPPTGPAGMDEEAWRALIDANLWSPPVPRGYTGMTTHVQAVPGALVVVHTADGHRRVRQVIDAICRLGESKEPQSPVTIPPPPPGTMEKQILAALDHPATLEFVEQPLKDVVNYLAEQHGIPLILMVDKLAEASVSPDIPITKNLQGISLRSALRLILKDLELTYVLRDEALIITTPEDAESQLLARAYLVKDLASEEEEVNQLIDVVTVSSAPQSWNEVGGPGLIRSVGSGWLCVSQANDVHEEVAWLLDQLRRMLSSADHALAMTSDPAEEADQKIRRALDQEIECDFTNRPLRDVVTLLQDKLQIPIVLAAKKLEEASVSPDTPLTAHWPVGRAGFYLELLLKELELTYVIRDEVLQITTPEDAESQLLTRLYDLRPLARVAPDPQRLAHVLQNVVTPQSWEAVGGPGSIMPFRGILVISQTLDVHEKLNRVLLAMNRFNSLNDASSSEGSEQPASIWVDDSLAKARVEEALNQVISVKIEDMPLEQALEQVTKPRGLFFIINRKQLEEVSVKALPRVSLTESNMTLGGVLDRLLTPLALGYTAREHALEITSVVDLDHRWEIRLHRISEVPALTKGDPAAFRDTFRAALPAMVLRHGAPSIEVYGLTMEVANSDWIIIDASRRCHEYIADWLTEQRTSQIPKRELERRGLAPGPKTLDPFAPPWEDVP